MFKESLAIFCTSMDCVLAKLPQVPGTSRLCAHAWSMQALVTTFTSVMRSRAKKTRLRPCTKVRKAVTKTNLKFPDVGETPALRCLRCAKKSPQKREPPGPRDEMVQPLSRPTNQARSLTWQAPNLGD